MDFGDSRGSDSGLLSPHGTGWVVLMPGNGTLPCHAARPFRPSPSKLREKKFGLPRTHGTAATLPASRLPIPWTAAGETVRKFFHGRAAIFEFLTRKWANELDYRLIKELWAFHENRISVRFQYEWRDDAGHWFRSHGNEQWEFDGDGLMRRREASINDVAIAPEDRKFLWPAGPRPASHPGLTALGL
jgi:nuclear transport factor 2 (NTF2) superfamily protein